MSPLKLPGKKELVSISPVTQKRKLRPREVKSLAPGHAWGSMIGIQAWLSKPCSYHYVVLSLRSRWGSRGIPCPQLSPLLTSSGAWKSPAVTLYGSWLLREDIGTCEDDKVELSPLLAESRTQQRWGLGWRKMPTGKELAFIGHWLHAWPQSKHFICMTTLRPLNSLMICV